MTEQDRISQIEQSLAGLEKQIENLKFELADLMHERQQADRLPSAGIQSAERLPSASLKPAVQAGQTPSAATPQNAPAISVGSGSAPISSAAPAAAPSSAPKTAAAFSSAPRPAVANSSAPKASAVKASVKEKSSSRFEENLGGKVMGIVAAILVFAGLFLFGSVLYEQLGKTARVVILFVVSFLILGTGFFLEHRRPSRFTSSLIGCGFGAIYSSLYITALYYGLFGVELLYSLLFIWLAGVGLYVFQRHSYAVALLGQIGIAFSVLFGSLGIESKEQFTFLCFYFTVLSVLYLWVVLWRFLPNTEKKPYPWLHLTAAGLNLIQLLALTVTYDSLFGKYSSIGGRNLTAGVVLCLYCFALPLFLLLRQRLLAALPLFPWFSRSRSINENTFPVYKAGLGSVFLFTAWQLVTWIVFSVISGTLFEAEVPHGSLLLLGLFASFVLIELFGPTGTEGRGACIVSATAVAFLLLLFDFPKLLQILIPMLFATVTLLFGLFCSEYPVQSVPNRQTRRLEFLCKQQKGRCFEKFTSYSYLLPLLLSYRNDDSLGILWLITLFGILFLCGSFTFLYQKGREQRYADAWKNILYIVSLVYIFWISFSFMERTHLEDIFKAASVLTLLVLWNSIAYYSAFRRKVAKPDTADPVTGLFVRLVSSGLWIWGIILLHSGAIADHPLLCIWMIALTLYLCVNGMYAQYKAYHNKVGIGIYFGLRVTLYVLAVLAAFDGIEGFVISCVLLILAILAVLSGFPLRLAPLRIYGLCLAMFAVIKLLMIDIKHDNSMETVLCFLSAGALCFAISFIYSHVKKKISSDIS